MAERFRDADIPAGERIAYRGAIASEPAGFGEQRVECLERDGSSYYRQLLEIEVREQARYRVETMFRRARGTIASESYRAETLDGDRRVAVEEGAFGGSRGSGGEASWRPSRAT